MIFNVEVELDIDGRIGLERVVMPMELQVRDIFEEGWAEINHKLRYKPDGTRRSEEDPLLTNWLSQLNALKTVCDGCSQHAWIIKEYGIREPDKDVPPRTKPMETTQDAISLLVATLPRKFNEKIYEIYELRARAQRIRDRVVAKELFNSVHRCRRRRGFTPTIIDRPTDRASLVGR